MSNLEGANQPINQSHFILSFIFIYFHILPIIACKTMLESAKIIIRSIRIGEQNGCASSMAFQMATSWGCNMIC